METKPSAVLGVAAGAVGGQVANAMLEPEVDHDWLDYILTATDFIQGAIDVIT